MWIICRYRDRWLLTEHAARGLEFPGGKVEPGEKTEEAAIREVYEETGGKVNELHYIGQYKVEGKNETVIKNVYFAAITELVTKDNYLETKGPRLIAALPNNLRINKEYSFIMKDDVLKHSLEEVARKYGPGV
ncbi:8-oxo-dGTP diphosphatase [Evansella caseinilytica]|uniref:8-oxo-dGTP diphosphatase n=1 Tax=Evansella caseinilytica TaxID=1503961 RepID=A0A1H3RXH3_9BACI|nr:8-oxo-dGTP diphosphatase [Evansella caseinilytica]